MKILLLSIMFISTLLSQTTICFKENTASSTKDKSLILDGGECQGKLSTIDMEKYGWKIKYAQVSKKDSGYNHLVIFKKEIAGEKEAKAKIQKIKTIKAKVEAQRLAFDISTREVILNDVTQNSATINIGNLKIGQSGIIVHKYNDKHSLIISSAVVKSSTTTNSTLMLYTPSVLTQNAIPTSKLQPKDGDIFVLNHMYNSSLLIVPNHETMQEVKILYPTQNFLNPDIFAAHLKINSLPLPQSKDVKEFCVANDIGTIFIVANNKLHILDTHSFKVLNETKLSVYDTKNQTPFFTKVTDIKKEFWQFGESEIHNYDNYYVALINNQTLIQNIASPKAKDEKTFFDEMMDMLPW